MAGLRGRPRSQDREPARPGPSGSISGSAVSATLHTEGRWSAAPAPVDWDFTTWCYASGHDANDPDARLMFECLLAYARLDEGRAGLKQPRENYRILDGDARAAGQVRRSRMCGSSEEMSANGTLRRRPSL